MTNFNLVESHISSIETLIKKINYKEAYWTTSFMERQKEILDLCNELRYKNKRAIGHFFKED